MCLLRWTLLLLFLIPATGHAQRLGEKQRNWNFHASAWLLWNTVHGDRYVQPRPPLPGMPLRDVDATRWRSFAKNTFSPATWIMVERHLWKGIWFAGGIEFVGRHQKYVFDPDTLAAYPPIVPWPYGLYVTKVKDRWYGLELPIMMEIRTGNWVVGAGISVHKNMWSKGVATRLDGSSYVLYDTPSRNSPLLSTTIPKVMFGYDGLDEEKRVRILVGADVRRKEFGASRRWVDVRIGASVRIG